MELKLSSSRTLSETCLACSRWLCQLIQQQERCPYCFLTHRKSRLVLLLLLLLCHYLIIILSASYNLGCMLVAAAFISTGQNNQSDDNKV